MIKKIGVWGAGLLFGAMLFSCEEDFTEVGGGLVKNTKFTTSNLELELKITPIDVSNVRADNLGAGAGATDYWLGVYDSKHYKKIEASVVTQLGFLKNPKIQDVKPAILKDEIDSIYSFDQVFLKLPYVATATGSNAYRLDSILGNPSSGTSLKVYRNGTFLNHLDPENPSQQNTFLSDQEYYIENPTEDLLNKIEGEPDFTFIPRATDSTLIINRHYDDGKSFTTVEKLANNQPFLSIPLDKDKMKALFWDKFNTDVFSNSQEFNNYFRGLILQCEGADGSLVRFDLTNSQASIDFYYTITRKEVLSDGAALTYKDSIPTKYSFPLSGAVRNVTYKMSPATVSTPANNFVIQGMAGTMAQVEVLGVNLEKLKSTDPDHDILKYQHLDTNPKDGYLDLQELAAIKTTTDSASGLLVTNALMSFYVNETVNTDKNIVPQRLFLYTTEGDDNSKKSVQVMKTGTDYTYYGGRIQSVEETNTPEKYTFGIATYLSDILDGTLQEPSPLLLKAFNATDDPLLVGGTRIFTNPILNYNWNPRGVTLLNENEAHGAKRAILKITYSEKK